MWLTGITTISLVLGVTLARTTEYEYGEYPSSETKPCSSPGTPAYAFRMGECCGVGSKVEYRCQTGYKLVGKSKLQCQVNGEWNHAAPRCEEIKNEFGLTLPTYFLASTDDRNSVLYDYYDYYDDDNDDDNDQFTSISDDYDYVEGLDYDDDDDDDDYLTERPTLKPTTTKQTDTAIPSTTRTTTRTTRTTTRTTRTTRTPPQRGETTTPPQRGETTTPPQRGETTTTPQRGDIHNDRNGDSIFSIDTICKQRPTVEHAKQETPIINKNMTVYECEDRYSLVEPRFGSYLMKLAETMECGSDGEWKGERPVCKELTCSLRRDRRRRWLMDWNRQNTYKDGDTIKFKCKRENYRLIGKPEMTCSKLAAGWTNQEPTCVYVSCPRTKLDNGMIFNTEVVYKTEQSYECFMGYELKGSSHRTCQLNGRWNDSTPVCLATSRNIYTECPNLPTPDGGYQESDGLRHGSTVTFTCGDGLFLRGSAIRKCLPEGYWSGTQPTCDGENSFDMPSDSAESITKLLDRLQLRRPEINFDRDLRKTLHNVDMRGTEMYFAIDTSGSIDLETFTATIKVVLAIVDKLDVQNGVPSGNKMGLLTFDTVEHVHIRPQRKSNKTEIKEKIRNLRPTLDGGTCMTCVIEKLERMMHDSKKLYRELNLTKSAPAYAERSKVVFIFTDGNYNMGGYPQQIYANNHRQQEYLDVVMVGMGGIINRRFLERMASSSQNVHILPDNVYLKKLATKLGNHISAFDECGIAGDFLSGRNKHNIFTFANDGSWPWVAALFTKSGYTGSVLANKMEPENGFQKTCSGTLIDNKWVLTINSCVNVIPPYFGIFVQLGIRKDEGHLTNQYRNVKDIKSVDGSNFVLLRLEEPIEPTAYVRPVCLPNEGDIGAYLENKKTGFTVGWGTYLIGKRQPTIRTDHLSQRLMYQDIRPLLDGGVCQTWAEQRPEPSFNENTDICAGRLNGHVNDCNYISDYHGDPVMTDNLDQTNRFFLTGLLRHGLTCTQERVPDVGIFETLTRDAIANIGKVIEEIRVMPQ